LLSETLERGQPLLGPVFCTKSTQMLPMGVLSTLTTVTVMVL
jgi:hypothetical protein